MTRPLSLHIKGASVLYQHGPKVGPYLYLVLTRTQEVDGTLLKYAKKRFVQIADPKNIQNDIQYLY